MSIKGFVPALETKAFRAVDAILRADPFLRGANVRFRSWRGQPDDAQPPALTEMPWLRLTPGSSDTGWEGAGLHRSHLSMKLEIAVAGLDTDDVTNFWGAIRSALFPAAGSDQETRVRAAVLAAGITQGELSGQPFPSPTAIESDAPVCLTGEGSLRLILFVPV